jgi:tRNA G46 methylase TrmB
MRPKILKHSQDNKKILESGLVTSSQKGIHPQLDKYVRRHMETTWAQPMHRATAESYRLLVNEGLIESGQALILDSGCGTGKSTRRLASLFPDHMVIGADRSISRLARGGAGAGLFQRGNCILMRAELATLWRLLHKDGYSPERHFLFYPNPWPKPGHLQRRWHAHPVFPLLLSLGGEIEMRCNWKIYALEFAQAVKLITGVNITVQKISPASAVSPFEKKYLERGQLLYAVNVPSQLAGTSPHPPGESDRE